MLQKIQSLFMRLVRHVEEHPAPLRRYFQLFFAILALRLSLEFFSSHRLFSLADVLHIGLWFLFIVLAFLVQLRLFSGESIVKVTKLVVVGFTIALTAPIIDLLVSGGVGAKMNYLALNSWSQVLYAYVTLGGPSMSRGATLGIRIEIILLVLASFNYVRTKRGSVWWGIAASLSIYMVLFLSGAVPRLLGMLVDVWPLQYGPEDNSTALLLLTLNVGLLAIALILYAPTLAWRVLRAVPWATVAIGVCHAFIGAGLAMRAYPGAWVLDPTSLFWFPLLLALLLCMALLVGLQRLQIGGGMASQSAEKGRNFLIALGLGLGVAISVRVAFVVAVIWGILFLLNEAPLNLRRAPLLRNLLEAMALVAVALLGFSAFGGPMVGFPTKWLLALLLLQTFGGLFTDLGRRGDDAFPWYGRWLSGFQRIFTFAVIALLLAAGVVAALILLPNNYQMGIVFTSILFSVAVIMRWPGRSQLALLALLPAYMVLAYNSIP